MVSASIVSFTKAHTATAALSKPCSIRPQLAFKVLDFIAGMLLVKNTPYHRLCIKKSYLSIKISIPF
jgi:hypothetical protein